MTGAKDRNPRHGGGMNFVAPTHNIQKVGEHTVTFMIAGSVEFGALVSRVHQQIDALLHAQGADVVVTEQELARYFATAVACRISHVTGVRFHVRVSDKWALPLPFAYAVAALGRIDLPSGLTVLPKFDQSSSDLVLNVDEFEDITARLRAIEPLGLRFAHAIESSMNGDDKVMLIVPVVTDQGDVSYTSQAAFTGVHAMTSAVLGAETVNVTGFIPPMWMPDYVIHERRLVQFRGRYADLNEAKA